MSAGSSFAGNNDKKNEKATKLVSGKVIDQNTGESLAGVEIKIDGTDEKVYTDFEGNFFISVPVNSNQSITFSALSYSLEKVNVSQLGYHSDISLKNQ